MEAALVTGVDPSGRTSRRRGEGGLPVTAIMTGGFALVLSFVILPGIVLGPAAVVIAVIAYRRARRDGSGGERLAVAGGVLGLVGLAISIAILANQLR